MITRRSIEAWLQQVRRSEIAAPSQYLPRRFSRTEIPIDVATGHGYDAVREHLSGVAPQPSCLSGGSPRPTRSPVPAESGPRQEGTQLRPARTRR